MCIKETQFNFLRNTKSQKSVHEFHILRQLLEMCLLKKTYHPSFHQMSGQISNFFDLRVLQKKNSLVKKN